MKDFFKKEVRIDGLSREYRILHITDAHLALWDENCKDYELYHYEGWPLNGTMYSKFVEMSHSRFTDENGVSSEARLDALFDRLYENKDGIDAVVFTGDIFDTYSDAAMRFVTERIKKLPMPYLYVMGNHDMLFTGVSDAEARARFLHLCGDSTEVQKLKLGELTLIGIDDTRNDYTDEAMSLFSEAINDEANVLMFQHVPLYTEEYNAAIIGCGSKDYSIGSEKVPETKNSAKMREIITAKDSRIRALICGDNHENTDTPIGNNRQITSAYAAMNPATVIYVHG